MRALRFAHARLRFYEFWIHSPSLPKNTFRGDGSSRELPKPAWRRTHSRDATPSTRSESLRAARCGAGPARKRKVRGGWLEKEPASRWWKLRKRSLVVDTMRYRTRATGAGETEPAGICSRSSYRRRFWGEGKPPIQSRFCSHRFLAPADRRPARAGPACAG